MRFSHQKEKTYFFFYAKGIWQRFLHCIWSNGLILISVMGKSAEVLKTLVSEKIQGTDNSFYSLTKKLQFKHLYLSLM